MNMSSSAARLKEATEPSPFPYAEVNPADAGPIAAAVPGASENQIRTNAFEQGRQAAQQQLQAELAAALDKCRQQTAAALAQFAAEREAYYRRVEGEIVRLALAIARKVLHREAQLDPHVLAGIVRVTLEKLDAGTTVTLCVSPREAADWRHYFACQVEGGSTPEVREDGAVAAGECRIETAVGMTEVGFESQLKEIETGLLDLLAERPGSVPSPPDGSH